MMIIIRNNNIVCWFVCLHPGWGRWTGRPRRPRNIRRRGNFFYCFVCSFSFSLFIVISLTSHLLSSLPLSWQFLFPFALPIQLPLLLPLPLPSLMQLLLPLPISIFISIATTTAIAITIAITITNAIGHF